MGQHINHQKYSLISHTQSINQYVFVRTIQLVLCSMVNTFQATFPFYLKKIILNQYNIVIFIYTFMCYLLTCLSILTTLWINPTIYFLSLKTNLVVHFLPSLYKTRIHSLIPVVAVTILVLRYVHLELLHITKLFFEVTVQFQTATKIVLTNIWYYQIFTISNLMEMKLNIILISAFVIMRGLVYHCIGLSCFFVKSIYSLN